MYSNKLKFYDKINDRINKNDEILTPNYKTNNIKKIDGIEKISPKFTYFKGDSNFTENKESILSSLNNKKKINDLNIKNTNISYLKNISFK